MALLWDEQTLCDFNLSALSFMCCHGYANGECEVQNRMICGCCSAFAKKKKILVEIPEGVTTSWIHGPLIHNLLDMEQ